MSKSINWTSDFNITGGYDYNTFNYKTTPFFKNAKIYYGNSTPPRSYNNPPGTDKNPFSLGVVVDPLGGTTGSVDESMLENGFKDSYALGRADGTKSQVNYAIVTDNEFNLINVSNSDFNIIKTMSGVQALYNNQNTSYKNNTSVDYQRGFYGVFNGYYQGFLDAVKQRTQGSPNANALLKWNQTYYELCNTSNTTTATLCSNMKNKYNNLTIDQLNAIPSTQIEKDISIFQKQYNDISANTPPPTNYTLDQYLKNLSSLYKAVKTQNDTTHKEIHNNINEFSADDQKVFYQNQQILSTSYLNIVLLIIYYLLFVAASYFIIAVDTHMDNRGKGLTILFFLLYPFLVNPICIYLYNIFIYWFAISNINIYSGVNY